MGTNYYSVKRDINLDGDTFWDMRGTEGVLHIGKSSAGWCFSLHVIPELGINDLNDWVRMFIEPDRVIINEYLEIVPLDRMMGVITCRSRPEKENFTNSLYERNFTIEGPNNLRRHAVGDFCLGHGEGTWDYISGEFS
jgi:hypothetical protein